MRLRAKLLIAFLVIAAIVVLTGGIGVLQIRDLVRAAQNVSDDATPRLYAIMEARLAVFESSVVMEQIMSGFQSINAQDRINASLDTANQYVSALLDGGEIGGLLLTPAPEGRVREMILLMHNELVPLSQHSEDRISAFLRTGRGEIRVDGLYRTSFDRFTDLSKTASGAILNQLHELTAAIVATSRHGILVLVIATVASLVVAVVFAYAFSGDVTGRVRAVMAASERIAHGDLTADIETRAKDEVGDLARNIEGVIESLRTIIGTVVNRVEVLEETGEKLQASTQTTATTAQQIAGLMDASRDQNEDLAANVTQTTAIIEEMARSIESLNGSVQQQASAIEESSASIEQMISSIENIASISNTAREELEKLDSASDAGRQALDEQDDLVAQMSSASDRLLEANELIAGVTEQTDLLAMNAAIEAAHAGEAGRGFAVVAEEIRKLAEMTGEQSRQVNSDIESIRSLIGRLVVGSRTSTEGFGSIQSSLNEVRNVFHEIHGAMQEQRSGGREILDALRQMRDLTTTVNDGSSEMRAGNEQMLTAIRNVNEITQSSRDSIVEVNEGIKRIRDAIDEIRGVSSRNRDQVEHILQATDRITLRAGDGETGEQPIAAAPSEEEASTGLMPSDGEVVPSFEDTDE